MWWQKQVSVWQKIETTGPHLGNYSIHNSGCHSTINLFTWEIVICGVIKLISWKIQSLAFHLETGWLCTEFHCHWIYLRRTILCLDIFILFLIKCVCEGIHLCAGAFGGPWSIGFSGDEITSRCEHPTQDTNTGGTAQILFTVCS